MNTQVIEQVVEQLKAMPDELQERVLAFARALALSPPRGVAGKERLCFAGAIRTDDIHLMRQAIDQGCEQVDVDAWQ